MTNVRIDITDADVRAAKRAWQDARDEDPSAARTALLRESYRRVVSGQAQQIADDFRRSRTERTVREQVTSGCRSAHPTAGSSLHTPDELGADELSPAERMVLAALGRDGTLDDIALQLSLTRNVVVALLRNVYRKIGVSTRADAVSWALQHDIR